MMSPKPPRPHEMANYDPHRRLAASIIYRALQDSKLPDATEALAWLASSAAEPYFDMLDMPQTNFLLRSGWIPRAKRALKALPTAPADQISTIANSLEYLQEYAE
jgi:hypothetical protein